MESQFVKTEAAQYLQRVAAVALAAASLFTDDDGAFGHTVSAVKGGKAAPADETAVLQGFDGKLINAPALSPTSPK